MFYDTKIKLIIKAFIAFFDTGGHLPESQANTILI